MSGGVGGRDARARRRGSVLVEVLVALILLAVGVLGLTAATAVVARQTEIARARHRLAERVQNEMELRLARLEAPEPDTAGVGDGRLEWSAEPGALRASLLVASLRWRSTSLSDTLAMVFRE